MEDLDQKNELRKVFIKCAWFLPLIAVAIVFPSVVLIHAGELESYDSLVDKQLTAKEQILSGQAYNNQLLYYKLTAVRKKKPEIISLGSSRVFQFRSNFFTPGSAFYNAGGGARRIEHFREFVSRIPDGDEPKIIIAGLDQVFFNPNWKFKDTMPASDKLFSNKPLVERWVWSRVMFLRDYFFYRKVSLNDIYAPKNDVKRIGIYALSNNVGVLNDGSWYFGNVIHGDREIVEKSFNDIKTKIEYGKRDYEFADHVSQDSLSELRSFLKLCRERGIHLIGFIPPFPHDVYAQLEKMKDKDAFVFKLPSAIKPLFDEYGASFFDFSDLAKLGAGDEEAFDGAHASEKAYLRLTLKLIEKDRVLRQFTDPEYLKGKLRNSDNPYVVFDINEL